MAEKLGLRVVAMLIKPIVSEQWGGSDEQLANRHIFRKPQVTEDLLGCLISCLLLGTLHTTLFIYKTLKSITFYKMSPLKSNSFNRLYLRAVQFLYKLWSRHSGNFHDLCQLVHVCV